MQDRSKTGLVEALCLALLVLLACATVKADAVYTAAIANGLAMVRAAR